MNRKILAACLLATIMLIPAGAQSVTFPDDITYDPYFSADIRDGAGNLFRVHNLSYRLPGEEADFFVAPNREDRAKYYFWITRGSDAGLATYALDFRKIQSIRFLPEDDSPEDVLPDGGGYALSEFTLTDGSVFTGWLKTEGFLGGVDEDFGVRVSLNLGFGTLNTIDFRHTGTYSRCPFCGALFYDTESEACPFDTTPLLPQNGG